jgi:hypothetical protein
VIVAAALIAPSSALASPSARGAAHAVVQELTQESRENGWPHYYNASVRCHPTGPKTFGCYFFLKFAEGPYAGYGGPYGHVAVSFQHRRYYMGEPSYEHLTYSTTYPCYTCAY